MENTQDESDIKINKINEIMEKHEISCLDDYFTDVFMTNKHEFIFRVTSQRFFESQEEANQILDETLNNLIEYSNKHINGKKNT